MTTVFNIEARVRHDLFAAFSYQKRSSRKGTVTGIELGGHFVFQWFVEEVWDHVSANVLTVNPYKFHAVNDLFNDPERWVALKGPFHIAAGRCLAYFEDKKMLPIECVNLGTGNRLYMVTTS